MSQKRNLATLDEFTNNEDITNGFRDKYSKRNNAEEAVPLKNSTSDARRSSSQTNTDGQEEDPESATYEDDTKPPEKKFKLPFLIACIVAVAFFIIILLLVAFWPRIPSYWRGELCVDKECLDASQQMLLWADISTGPCENTYQWACGRFESEYTKHHFFGVHRGEWNFDAFHEYEEIKNLDFFISSLPQQGYANNPSTILKGLYKSCRELESLDKNQGNTQLKKAINTLGIDRNLLHKMISLDMIDIRRGFDIKSFGQHIFRLVYFVPAYLSLIKMMFSVLVFLSLGLVVTARPQRGYNVGPANYQDHRGYNVGHPNRPYIPNDHVYARSVADKGYNNQQEYGNEEEPIITKQFYIHSAPEDPGEKTKKKHFKLGRAQKNYRVIFIKAPAANAANAQISAEYAPQEEKTVIYVLSQKEHEVNINEISTPAPTLASKPEVFFIKYKTPEEAEHAQAQIQAQYDTLGGVNQVSDEGTIPSSSVVGSLDRVSRQPRFDDDASSDYDEEAFHPQSY